MGEGEQLSACSESMGIYVTKRAVRKSIIDL